MDVILFGPPGAGKGTQAMASASRLGIRHLSTGDLLRDEVRAGTDLGAEVRRYMDGGQYVPDEIVDRMVETRLKAEDCRQGVLFDGYPRTIAQAQALDRELQDLGRKIDSVVVLEVDDSVICERLAGRRTCPQCRAMFHVVTKPPKMDGRCDACGAVLVQRSDDQPRVIAERLAVYHRDTSPLLSYYRQHGVVRSVDGAGGIVDVTVAVLRALGRN